MKIDFWDVGQGDCTIITRADGSLTLIDVGPKNSPIISWISEQRGTNISDIVLTHNDSDHIGALPSILEVCGSKIQKVWLLQDGNRSGARQRSVVNLLTPLKEASEKYNIRVRTIRSGMDLWQDNATSTELKILYPSDIDAVLEHSTPNMGSAILALAHIPSNQSIIWPGDNTVTRTDLVKPAQDRWLLHGPHHGAPEDCRTPNRTGFFKPAETLSPKYAYISVGSPNSHNHPSLRYITKLRRLGCQVVCSGLTRYCDRQYKEREAGRHVMNGSALLGLRRIAKGFSCRGAMRINVTHQGFCEDDFAKDHLEAVKNLSHPFCLPRDQWKR